jgi:hypothetical protein
MAIYKDTWGAMSRWLIENPAQANPPHPRDNDMHVMAHPRFINIAVNVINKVWQMYDAQVNSFRT